MVATSADLRQRIRAALQAQPQKTVTVLSSLLATQDAIGYLPPEAIEEVATFTDKTTNDVWDVASFYMNFRFTPPGDHTVEVCWGPTCHLVGAQDVAQGVMEALGLENEGDTPDGSVTFRYNTCLGCCAVAPAMAVDHHLVGRVDRDEAVRRVNSLRREPRRESR